MSESTHTFTCSLEWTGNRGPGTSAYKAYGRDHTISIPGKPLLRGSSAPAFRGDSDRHNPEDLLVAALSACHMLWYLHLAAEAGVVVTSYEDEAEGVLETVADGAGQFTRVTLRPRVGLVPGSDPARALGLHREAHKKCFIARSVNFPVICEPSID